jgi:hypothetical protein
MPAEFAAVTVPLWNERDSFTYHLSEERHWGDRETDGIRIGRRRDTLQWRGKVAVCHLPCIEHRLPMPQSAAW